MKPTIDDRIEAVDSILRGTWIADAERPALEAALSTLRWVKRHAPLIKTILGEFEGVKVLPKGEE